MTTQDMELFEYEGEVYELIGIQGGGLIPINELIVEIPWDALSSGLWRGYQGVFAVDEKRRLILKTARYISYDDDDMQEKQVNQVIPMTGHILFGDYHRPEWLVEHISEFTNPDDLRMFEAEIAAGSVLSVKSCAEEILSRIRAMPSEDRPYYRERERHITYRDWLALFLPRRYDVFYWGKYGDLSRLS